MTKVDIKKYAALARIAVSDEEAKALEKDIDSILEYVGQVSDADISLEDTKDVGDVYNVFREDTDAHEPGEFTDTLLKEAPATKKKDGGQWVEVKNIL